MEFFIGFEKIFFSISSLFVTTNDIKTEKMINTNAYCVNLAVYVAKSDILK